MKEEKKLDWLASQILAMFKDLGFDSAYIEDTENSLSGRDRFSVLLWCNNLDARCKLALTKQLGINADDFNTTIKTIQSL